VSFIILFCFVGTLAARTWYILDNGGGDAPSIEAAMDSCVSGDTVLVAPGVHEVASVIVLNNGIVVLSEAGPLSTKIVPKENYFPSYAFACQLLDDYSEISGFWIEGFRFYPPDSGTITVFGCYDLFIRNNIMVNNGSTSIAIDNTLPGRLIIEGNTLINDGQQNLIIGNSGGSFNNNIVWGHPEHLSEPWIVRCNCMLDVSDAGFQAEFNFQADPQYCGTDGINLYLQSDSPCAPGNTPLPFLDCGLVGALPVGCGTTPLENTTWGGLKSIYK
jgi:hypothetical protein